MRREVWLAKWNVVVKIDELGEYGARTLPPTKVAYEASPPWDETLEMEGSWRGVKIE
jgi:hypothetical protein